MRRRNRKLVVVQEERIEAFNNHDNTCGDWLIEFTPRFVPVWIVVATIVPSHFVLVQVRSTH
jgi:hypothetical protein